VAQHEAGIASGLLNTMQQVGGSLGLAALASISTTVADNRFPHADVALFQAARTHDVPLLTKAANALTSGYTAAFLTASILMAAGLVILLLTVKARKQEQPAPQVEPEPAIQVG
jgi:hypothetical protein